MANGFPFENLEIKQLTTPRVKLITLCFAILAAAGITAGLYASMVGHNFAYGLSREIPWGILISSYSFFAITSIGLCMITAISHAYWVTTLAPLRNRAVYLSLVTLASGLMLIACGIETPWRLIVYNALSPNLTSNIWWLCTLYGIMTGCMFLKFAALLSNRHDTTFKILIVGAVAGVGANNNLGALFTASADPPIWHGTQLLIFFLASAVLAGTATIVIFTDIAYRIRNQRMNEETDRAMQSAGTIIALMLAIITMVTLSRFYALFFGDTAEAGKVTALALINGPLSITFWGLELILGLVVPLAMLIATKVAHRNTITIAAAMALAGVFFHKYNLIVAGQLVPKFSGWNDLPAYLHYTPSITEIVIVLGAMGLTATGFLLGERFLGRIFP